ncbi:hypothetical protein CG740_10445 [Streptomyces sp. CB01201]|uniref:hypothetical protein n=1 Tax=Streptomyces sp. CB01201 TaxID=2020324 RepID=UPI000C27E0BC|nr:hypothetical protein [Streptomyces sp. CB01201]PJN02980.1 hypothetical protein CG740_10445 [Streptomyces sp. CB01201]
MRPKAAARAAVLTATALLAAACAGPPDGSAESVSTRTPTALERAALTADDVPGYEISGAPSPGETRNAPRADRADCAPLAEVMGTAPDDRARATVSRGLGSRRSPGLAVSASLSAYSAADARRLMDGLRTALARCGAGFGTVLDGRGAVYRDVRAVTYEVAGDASVSWTASVFAQGAPAPVHILVVRQGATIVRFMAIDLSGRAPAAASVPHDIADRQLAKLIRTVGD